jgi:hypothetical protein
MHCTDYAVWTLNAFRVANAQTTVSLSASLLEHAELVAGIPIRFMNDGDGPDVRVLQLPPQRSRLGVSGWAAGNWTRPQRERSQEGDCGGRVVCGRLESRPIGSYESKSRRRPWQGLHLVAMFALHVEGVNWSIVQKLASVSASGMPFSSTIPFLPAARQFGTRAFTTHV